MKKIKLLTSLSTLAVVGSTVPFVTTSCNDKKDDEGTKEFTAISYNGVKIYDKNEPVSLVPTKLNIGTSTKYNADNFKATIGDSTEFVITKVTAKSNDKTVEINNASENSNFTVTGKAVGNADVEVTVEDANGDKATATIKFTVVNEPIYKISASEGTPENCI